jgi:hypothetical protein
MVGLSLKVYMGSRLGGGDGGNCQLVSVELLIFLTHSQHFQ